MSLLSHYDVVILGAGPAGTTCALQLRHSNLKVLLIDKASFPRDKICGDAIGGISIKTLQACCPELTDELRAFPKKTKTEFTRIYVHNIPPFDIHWVNEGFCCKRIDFDHMLVRAVKKYAPNVTFLENFKVDTIEINEQLEGGISVGNKTSGQFFTAKILIGGDGSQSLSAKKLTGFKLQQRDHAGSVRAYFKGVKGMVQNRTEIFVLPQFSPGYLWVFPVSEDEANVGFGMLSSKISEGKVNLRSCITAFIDQSPELKKRFEGSQQISPIGGFGLALGTKQCAISGDHFLLIGDAASLIDPASGDSISNAIVSGQMAAETALEAFKSGNFSASFLHQYDKKLFACIGGELWKSTLFLRFQTRFPFLINIAAPIMNVGWVNRFAKRFF